VSKKTQFIAALCGLALSSFATAGFATGYQTDCDGLNQFTSGFCTHVTTYISYLDTYKPPKAAILPDSSYDMSNSGSSGDNSGGGNSGTGSAVQSIDNAIQQQQTNTGVFTP